MMCSEGPCVDGECPDARHSRLLVHSRYVQSDKRAKSQPKSIEMGSDHDQDVTDHLFRAKRTSAMVKGSPQASEPHCRQTVVAPIMCFIAMSVHGIIHQVGPC